MLPRANTEYSLALNPLPGALPVGDFTLPVCLDAETLERLLATIHAYQNLSGDYDPVVLERVLAAMERIIDGCDLSDVPPFWEDVDDYDGAYGEIPLWSRVGLWVLTGFMLYSGDPVAVLTYRHSVRRLLIRYYQAGWGGVFDVLVNGTLIDTIDSAGPDAIKDIVYDLDDILPLSAQIETANPYELEIRRKDTDPAKAIGIMRGYLPAPEPSVVDSAEWVLNFNSGLGVMELIKDDVVQESIDVVELVEPPWVDIATIPDYTEPEPLDIRCSAATGAQVRFKTLVWEPLKARFDAASNFLSFVMAAYAIIVANPIVTLSFDVLKTLWDIWTSDIDLDADDWQTVRCIFYNNLPESGLFDNSVLSSVNAALLAENSVKMNAVAVIIAAMVFNGINYSERVEPDESADCADCSQWEVIFGAGYRPMSEWQAATSNLETAPGDLAALGGAGDKWDSVHTVSPDGGRHRRHCGIQIDMGAEVNIIHFQITVDHLNGSGPSETKFLRIDAAQTLDDDIIAGGQNNGDRVARNTSPIDGINTLTFTGNKLARYLRVYCRSGMRADGVDPGGYSNVTQIVVRGTGVNPFA